MESSLAWTHLLAFNLTLLAAMLSPGPALLVLLRTAIARGRAAGMATGAGLALVAAGWTGAALFGLDAIFTLVPWAYLALKTAGAAYLIWIAWTMWRSAHDPLEADATPGAARPGAAFRQGLLVNLSNPKSVLFAASVLVVIFPPDMAPRDSLLIVVNHLGVELIFYTTLALALSTRPARAGYLRLKSVFDRLAAMVLGALGLKLLIDR